MRAGEKKTSASSPLANLEKLRFTIHQQATLAALLLFGNHSTNIHIGRFKSADTIMDDIMIKSPFLTAVEEAMHFIQKNIQVRFEFDGHLQRIEKWQFPLEAIRELLLNAIIHRDYHQPTDLIIKIFDDSITFINPGNLSPSLTVAELQTDNYLAVHRNKLLAEAFSLIGEVEKYGTGFIRIRKFLLSYPKMKLLFEELNGFIRATLVTNETDGKSSGKIIQLMLENKQITIPEIAEQLTQTTRSVEKQLANLRKAGIIQRIGPAKGGAIGK